MKKTRILIVFGTRPEAIKMAPLVKGFEEEAEYFDVKVCVTAQHREMLDQVLDFFEITPDFDLDLMKTDQGLCDLTQSILEGITGIIKQNGFNYVFVQGDTTTSFVASLAAFYEGVKVCHIEAGLRTYNKKAPFPEEVNRQLISRIADLHFAPTELARQNLLSEGIDSTSIQVTGNTVIDALFNGIKIINKSKPTGLEKLEKLTDPNKKLVIVTGHRRENFGEGFKNICKAIKRISEEENVQIIYPVHLNPNVQKTVNEYLGNNENIHLIEPLPYPEFLWLMNQAFIILTDSGGVQEEAPSLGKPVLVMRDTTERPEAVEVGTVILVGTDPEKIFSECKTLLNDSIKYESMSQLHNPYGDGNSAKKIIQFLIQN